eukprot:Skav225595  [mRNA]  locus=scaffold1527:176854:181635:- [translate_table: standard]
MRKTGGRTTIVARIQIIDENHRHGHLCTGLISGQAVRLKCAVPKGISVVTVINASVGFYRLPILEIDDQAAVLHHPTKTMGDLFTLSETCAGIGGIGKGAAYAGWQTVVQNDLQAEFCRYQSKVATCPVVQGDISHMRTVIAMHEAAPQSGAMAFGFACQPFSGLGDMREGEDSRANSLPAGLYASWLLQKDLVVLECVPNAANSQFVQKCLLHHMQQTRMERSETLLELADMWPAKRRRWWTVLSRGDFGKVTLQPLPRVDPSPCISHLFPAFMNLPQHEWDDLQLTSVEVKAFCDYGKGTWSHVLDMNAPMGTALHSWGNQCHDCACGCRPAFSHSRLQKFGLYGALVPSSDGQLRHISPRELAILNGMPMKNFEDKQRLLLAGLGQLASPIQATWIFAQIRAHLCESRLTMVPTLHPKVLLAGLCEDLFRIRDGYFTAYPTVQMQLFRENIMKLFLGDEHGLDEVEFQQALANMDETSTGPGVAAAAMDTTECPTTAPAVVDAHAMPGTESPTFPGPSQTPPVRPVETGELSGSFPECPTVVPAAVDAHAMHGIESPTFPCPSHAPDVMSNGVEECREMVTECPTSVPADVDAHAMHGTESPTFPCPSRPHDAPAVDDSMNGEVESRAELAHAPHAVTSSNAHMDMTPRTDTVDSLCEPTTGALRAFGTNQSHVVTPQLHDMATHEAPSHGGAIEQLWDILLPQDLIAGKVMIFDCDTGTLVPVQHADDATVRQLVEAEFEVSHQTSSYRTVLGHVIDVDTTLDKVPMLIKGNYPENLSDDMSIRSTQLAPLHRLLSLLFQGAAVAVDEMDYYLRMVAEATHCKHHAPCVLENQTDVHALTQPWFQAGRQSSTDGRVLSACLLGKHWIPVVFDHMQVTSVSQGVAFFHSLNLPVVEGADIGDVVFANDCGFQTIAWLAAYSTNCPFEPMELEMAQWFRYMAWVQQYQGHLPNRPLLVLGGQSELEVALSALLSEHGVFMNRVSERAQLVISRLGVQAVTDAIKSTRPWMMLKQLANAQKPELRLVLQDEFESVVKDRTKDGRVAKTKKKPHQHNDSRVSFGPDDIHIPDGVFCHKNGRAVSQLPLDQIKAGSQGIVLTTEQGFQPYMHRPKLASEGLAFLVMAPFSAQVAELGVQIRFPAQSKATQEPILLSAVLIQKGDGDVQRAMPEVRPQVEQVPTQTLKVLVYRDQVAANWEEVCSKPVRYVLSHSPELQTCTKTNCTCGCWHPTEQHDTDALLDVWARDFVSAGFSKAKPGNAALFVCMMRVIAPVFPDLSKGSGRAGIYYEPRSADGRKHDAENFHTVWMSKMTLEEAVAARNVAPVQSSLIRVNHRYGLRVPAKDGPSLHSHVKPNVPFLGGGLKTQYLVGPFPFGTTKAGIQKLFAQWQWPAQVLQPYNRSQDMTGLMWQASSHQAPSTTVYVMSHGDVMITRDSAPPSVSTPVPRIEASKMAKPHVEVDESNAMVDPWQKAASMLPSYKPAPAPAKLTATQIQELEESVEKRVLARMQPEDDPMSGEALAPRVSALETQLRELASAHAVTQSQTQQLQTSVDQVHHQIANQQTALQNTIQTQLKEQMTAIEALLNKRAKHE